MNGVGKITSRTGSYIKNSRSVSIFEAIRLARILNGQEEEKSNSTLLHKDWERNEDRK